MSQGPAGACSARDAPVRISDAAAEVHTLSSHAQLPQPTGDAPAPLAKRPEVRLNGTASSSLGNGSSCSNITHGGAWHHACARNSSPGAEPHKSARDRAGRVRAAVSAGEDMVEYRFQEASA